MRTLPAMLASPAAAILFAVFFASSPALADCAPANPGPGGVVFCTGVDADGFVDPDGFLSVTVSSGATLSNIGAHAMDLRGSDSKVSIFGTISTTGNNARGIRLEDRSVIWNHGTVTTVGDLSRGLDVQEMGTIYNFGSVTTGGDSSDTLHGHDGSKFYNYGMLTTTGPNSDGIDVDNDSIVVNAGTIRTNQDFSYGILALDNGIITNSGMINTKGFGGFGIEVEDDGRVLNSGTISTSGVLGLGINIDDRNTLTNTGMIYTKGDGGVGIFADDDNTITNTGYIKTSGELSDGVVAEDYNQIENTGSIYVSGIDSYGMYLNDSNTVTNSGKVVSAHSYSFSFCCSNILNLNAPSYLGGAIDFGGGTTLNIKTGPSHSVLWDFNTGVLATPPSISGPVPWFYNSATQKFATYDPTALAIAMDELAHLTQLISGLKKFGSAQEIWSTKFGSIANLSGNATTLDRSLYSGGFAVGASALLTPEAYVSASVGYLGTFGMASSRWTRSLENKSHGLFANAHTKIDIDDFYLSFGIASGGRQHSDRRFVNDNILPDADGHTLGVSWTQSNYASWWVSPEIGIATLLDGPDGWSLVPSANLRFSFQHIDGLAETGSNANAAVPARNHGIGEASIEIEARKKMATVDVSTRVGVLGRAALGNDATDVTLLGITNPISSGFDNQLAAYLGVSVATAIGETGTFEFGFDVVFGDRTKSASAKATLANTF